MDGEQPDTAAFLNNVLSVKTHCQKKQVFLFTSWDMKNYTHPGTYE